MYTLSELAFEALVEKAKQDNNGNPFVKGLVDNVSHVYDRQQYNDCHQHINEENNQIANICYHISQPGCFVNLYEQQEILRHVQLRSEYEKKHETSLVREQRCRIHRKLFSDNR